MLEEKLNSQTNDDTYSVSRSFWRGLSTVGDYLSATAAILKVSFIAGATALSTLLPQQARADTYVPLPEPRYVQEKVEDKAVGSKQFPVPVTKDTWTELLEQKAQKLEDIVYMGCGGWHESLCARSCDHFKVSSTAINCDVDVKECTNWETRESDFFRHHFDDITVSTSENDRVCTSSTTYSKSKFYAPYAELYDIRQCGGWGLDNDNVCFRRGGKDYDFDVQDSGTAARAAELMRELKSIALQISRDGRSYRVKEEAEQAQWDYERAFLYQHRLETAVDCVQHIVRGNIDACLDNALRVRDRYGGYVNRISDDVSEKSVPLHYKKWSECEKTVPYQGMIDFSSGAAFAASSSKRESMQFNACFEQVFRSGPTRKEIRAALAEKLREDRSLLQRLR